MVHRRPDQVRCSVCRDATPKQAQFCRECKGRRYVTLPAADCHGEELYDCATGGWECRECGNSGPY